MGTFALRRNLVNTLCKCTLVLLVAMLCAGGCSSRRTRLHGERSTLLRERDQMQGQWDSQSQLIKPRQPKEGEQATPPKERIQQIEERVAEIDLELLELPSSGLTR